MLEIDKLIKTVEDAVKLMLSDRVIKTDDIITEIKELVVPVLTRQNQVISRQSSELRENLDTIIELTEDCQELNEVVEDMQKEKERQDFIIFFNKCLDGKVVY